GSGAGTLTLTGGALGAGANHTSDVQTKGDGEAAGDDTAVGLSMALNIGDNDTDARIGRSVTGAGAEDVEASGIRVAKAESKASSKGGSDSGGDSDQQTSSKTNLAQSRGGGSAAPSQTGSSAVGTGNSNATTQTGQSGGTGSGGTSVAATIAVNYLKGDTD